MSEKKVNDTINKEMSIDFEKRKFMDKVGKYAVGAGMATLMTPTLSTADNYKARGPQGNNGWGNGDQAAPGNSLTHNQAEKYDTGRYPRKE